MRLIVVSVTSPPARLRGYLRRFLLEPAPCLFVGGVSRDLADDVRGTLIAEDASGFMLVSAAQEELGCRFEYFRQDQQSLIDFDGISLVEVVRK